MPTWSGGAQMDIANGVREFARATPAGSCRRGPLDPRYTEAGARYIIEHSGASAVVVDGVLVGVVAPSAADQRVCHRARRDRWPGELRGDVGGLRSTRPPAPVDENEPGGVNVYPRAVEDVIGQHPSINDVAVVRPTVRAVGEEVAADVVLAPGATLTPTAWRHTAAVAARLQEPAELATRPRASAQRRRQGREA